MTQRNTIHSFFWLACKCGSEYIAWMYSKYCERIEHWPFVLSVNSPLTFQDAVLFCSSQPFPTAGLTVFVLHKLNTTQNIESWRFQGSQFFHREQGAPKCRWYVFASCCCLYIGTIDVVYRRPTPADSGQAYYTNNLFLLAWEDASQSW